MCIIERNSTSMRSWSYFFKMAGKADVILVLILTWRGNGIVNLCLGLPLHCPGSKANACASSSEGE